MGNFSRIYLLHSETLRTRMLPGDLTGLDQPISVESWISNQPQCYEIWKVLFDKAGPGVRFVTYLHKTSGFPETEKLFIYLPELKSRFEPVDYFEIMGEKYPRYAYDNGSDFPPGYSSWLTGINCAGWQFFTYDEIDILIPALEMLIASGDSSYSAEWQELINDHNEYDYDLILFEHMV